MFRIFMCIAHFLVSVFSFKVSVQISPNLPLRLLAISSCKGRAWVDGLYSYRLVRPLWLPLVTSCRNVHRSEYTQNILTVSSLHP